VRYSVRIQPRATVILAEVSCGFPQVLQAKVGTVPELDIGHIISVHCSLINQPIDDVGQIWKAP
jgi:hypothetical protein